MQFLADFFKVVILSLVEGITEFLPVSSTGHLILVNNFVELQPQAFANAFSIIIQLGAILSVVVIYFSRLNPWDRTKAEAAGLPSNYERMNGQSRFFFRLTHPDKATFELWLKVIVGVIPAGILGFLFDDFIDAHLMNTKTVTITLIAYGILIILVENAHKNKTATYATTDEFSYKLAFAIGCFQCLAMIPGTSRSAATIIGAMVLGASRYAAAEFSFFLAIPTMVGATLLKIVKNLGSFTGYQWLLIWIGFALSFIVAYVVIKKFMAYISKHDFKPFGYYRIALGAVMLIYMLVTGA